MITSFIKAAVSIVKRAMDKTNSEQEQKAPASEMESRGIKVNVDGSFTCPMCGWTCAKDQKVCRNSRCGIRF